MTWGRKEMTEYLQGSVGMGELEIYLHAPWSWIRRRHDARLCQDGDNLVRILDSTLTAFFTACSDRGFKRLLLYPQSRPFAAAFRTCDLSILRVIDKRGRLPLAR